MTTPFYEFIVKDKQGNALATLDTARNRKFNLYLNKSGDAQFDISLSDPKITQDMLLLGDKELYIYRKGILLWGGELTTSDIKVDDATETATITAKGFLDLLSKKLVGTAASPRTFTATDAGTIVSTLLSEVQTGTNASLGIATGIIQTSVNRTVSYSYQDLQQIIQNLSSDNIDEGFDFDVDAQKKLSIWYPARGRVRSDITFEYGRNLFSFEEQADASGMVNEVIVLGAGSGGSMVTQTVDQATEQATYKIRQTTLSKKDTSDTGILSASGQAQLTLLDTPQKQLTIGVEGNIDPIIGSYNCGDSVHVVIKKGWYSLDSYFRIYQISVTLSDDGDEQVQLTLSPFIRDIIQYLTDMQKRLKALEVA